MPTHPYFASDLLVEAEAELAFDARDILPVIPVPVLLVCGDEDMYIPKDLYEETARLIPDCTLRTYEGIGHVGAVRDERFPRDVLDFVRQRPTAGPEAETEPPAIAHRPAAASVQPAEPQAAASGAG